MPHNSLPPIPAAIISPYQRHRQLNKYLDAKAYAESGQLTRQRSTDPADDAVLALHAAIQAGAPQEQLQTLATQATEAHKAGIKERFLNALRAGGLPFEAFAEGVNALVGPAIPQEKFRERSAQSRQILKGMFTGQVSLADAAGALRNVYEQRSGWEQLITGFAFDPTNVLVPGVTGLRAGLRVGEIGARAGFTVGAEAAARKALTWTLPFGGGKVADHLGLQATKRLLMDATSTHGEELVALQRRHQKIIEGRLGAAGASGTESDAAFELGKASWFFDAVENPAKAAKLEASPVLKSLAAFYKAGLKDANPTQKALLRLSIETAGRPFELGNILVEDVDFTNRTVSFHAIGRPVTKVRIEEFSPEAMDLLREATAGKPAGAPVFTHKEILGTRGRSLDDALGSHGLNTFVESIARASGMPAPTKSTIRKMVASAYAEAAFLGGGDPHALRGILAHAEYDFKTLNTYAGLISPSLHADVVSLARYLTGAGENVKYVGLAFSTESAAAKAAVGLGEKAARLRAEIKRVPELKGVKIQRRKSMGGTAPILGQQAAKEGITRLETLPIDTYASWFDDLAARDKTILSVATRMVVGLNTANDLEAVRDYAEVALTAAIKTTGKSVLRESGKGSLSPVAAAWRRVVKESQADLKRLWAGLGEYNEQLQPDMGDLRRIMTELEGQGKATARNTSDLTGQLGAISQLIRARSESLRHYIGSGGKITTKELETMGLDYASMQEKPGLQFLELADITTAQSKVMEWLGNEQIRKVLSRYGIEVGMRGGVPILTERMTALRTKLLRIASSPAAHLLGNDLHTPASGIVPRQFRESAREVALASGRPVEIATKGPDEIARSHRVMTIIGALPPDALVELEHKSLVTRGAVEGMGALPVELEDLNIPVPTARPSSAVSSGGTFLPRDAERKATVADMVYDVTLENAGKNVRSNPKLSNIIDIMERNIARGNWVWANKLGHNLLQAVSLPNASLGDVPLNTPFKMAAQMLSAERPRMTLAKDTAAWTAGLPEIEAQRGVNREIFYNTPGQKQFDKQYIDVRTREWHSDDLELSTVVMTTPEWEALVKGFEGRPITFRGGLHTNPPASYTTAEKLAYDELHRPQALVGGLPVYGLSPVALNRLSDIWKLTPEQIAYVGELREYSKLATDTVIKRVGKAKVEEWLGHPISKEYFPRVATAKMREELKAPPPLAARKLDQPGIWTKERQVRDLVDAREQVMLYDNPVDSVVDYMADTQRLALDNELIKTFEAKGFAIEGKAKWVRQDQASRTLLSLAELVSKGKQLGVENLSNVSRLLGYKDTLEMTEQLTMKMGALAKDVLEHPEKASDWMPKVQDLVGRAQEGYDSTMALHELTKGLPGLGNHYFESSVQAKRAVQFFASQNKDVVKFMQSLNKASSALRMMQAGVDLSPMMIQGLMLPAFGAYKLFTGAPGQAGITIWSRAIGAAWKAMGTLEYHSAYVAANGDIIKDLVRYSGVWSDLNEMVAGASTLSNIVGGTAGAVTGLIGKPGWGYWLKNIPEAAERFFTVFLQHARLELWKSLRPMAMGDEGRLRELASVVNKMTGVYNPATSGTTQFQRYMEGTFLSFAAMYRRAAYGLIVDAFRDPGLLRKAVGQPGGRLDTVVAQEALISLIGAGVTFAYIAKESGNNPDALNPHSAKFLSFQVGGHYIGLGSAYYSLVRAAYAVTEQAMDSDPEKGRKRLLNIADVRDNQFSRWWRSQAPPLPQAGIDFILGQTYIGEPLRGADGGILKSAWKWAGSQITPMTLDTIIHEMRSPGDAPAVVGEGFGLRTFPQSLYDQKRNLANNLLHISDDPETVAWRKEQSGGAIEASRLPILLRNRLESSNKSLQDLSAKIEQNTLLRGSNESKRTITYFQQVKKNKDFVNQKMEAAVAAFHKNLDPKAFRDAISEAKFAGLSLSKRLNDEYSDVTGRLDEQKKVRAEKASTFVGDLIYDRFITNVVQSPLTTDEDGNFLPHVYGALVDRFMMENGPVWWDYVQERRKQAKQYPSLVNEYFGAQETLQPYWELHYRLWGKYSDNAQLIDHYNGLSPLYKAELKDSNPKLRVLLRRLDEEKLNFRRANPELDWLLTKWFGNVPRTTLARERLAIWQSQGA